MRTIIFAICLMLSLALVGCAKQWDNDDSGNKQQSNAQFERDSLACQVSSGEAYPLDKHRQLKVYNQCMSDKGWVQRDRNDSIRFK